jgi:pimeloyl-ACP methyl ester carboxylesterase
MHVLALSGWAQFANSLEDVLPPDAHSVSYGDCAGPDEVFARLAVVAQPDVAVGWSLGGQLLVRAVAAGIIRPRHLVLLGAPYQLVADARFPEGKSKRVVAGSRLALKLGAGLMLREFQHDFLAYGDREAASIKRIAPRYLDLRPQNDWLLWYDELARFSCADVDFSAFARTSIIHGTKDVVIPPANATAFARSIKGAELHLLEECGHAPHWHDANFVKQVITGA